MRREGKRIVASVVIASVSQDDAEAHAIAKALAAHGWPARRVVLDGQAGDAEAESAIGATPCFVVLWSSEAARNQRLIGLAGAAHRRGILLPIRLDDAVHPMPEAGALDLSHWPHAADRESLSALVEAVARIAGPPRLSGLDPASGAAASGRAGRRRKPGGGLVWVVAAVFLTLGAIVAAAAIGEDRLAALITRFVPSEAAPLSAPPSALDGVDAQSPYALRALLDNAPNAPEASLARQALDRLELDAWRKAADASDALSALNALAAYRSDFPGQSRFTDAAALETARRAQISETLRRLRALGFLGEAMAFNDAELTQAVRAFQAAYRQPVDGRITDALITALRAANGDSRAKGPDPILQTAGANQSLQRFRDCYVCPEMVVLPAGQFFRQSATGLQPITLAYRIAIGRTEVTFEEWDACADEGGCSQRPADAGWGRGDRPVINVSYPDARQFTTWLSRKVGQTYRLPSEAEWEYAARAGAVGAYPFGEQTEKLCAFANGADLSSTAPGRNQGCRDPAADRTMPVARLGANAFGLFDTLGNAAEWVGDCWAPSLVGSPRDGSARVGGGCMPGLRTVRGGAFDAPPDALRLDAREAADGAAPSPRIGFRVARLVD